MPEKLKLEDIQIRSFVTREALRGGDPQLTLYCLSDQVTECLIIGTNQMVQCIEGGCGN